MSLNIHQQIGKVKLSARGTFTYARNKIVEYDELPQRYPWMAQTGMRINENYLYIAERLYTKEDFIVSKNGSGIETYTLRSELPQSTLGGLLGPGDIKYKDLDGNGVIDRGDFTADNHGDLKVIGNSTPRYEYSGRIGLDYKGFDLDIFFQGVGSRQIWASGNLIIPGFQFGDGVYYAHQTDYWTPENPDAFYARLSKMNQPSRYAESGGNYMPQSKYLLNMSYCRLKSLTLGYSLPTNLIQKAYLNKVRVYVSGENLFTIDKLGDIPLDPETNTTSGDGGTQGFGRIYPYVRTWSFGLQVSF